MDGCELRTDNLVINTIIGVVVTVSGSIAFLGFFILVVLNKVAFQSISLTESLLLLKEGKSTTKDDYNIIRDFRKWVRSNMRLNFYQY